MSEESVVFKLTTFDKTSLSKVVDRRITTFVNEDNTAPSLTVEEFFAEYERLYFDIPINGENQSHEYLIKKSSELLAVDTTQDIQPLLDEIASLRDQLLELTRQNIELQSQTE